MKKIGVGIIIAVVSLFIFQGFMVYGYGNIDSAVIVSVTAKEDEISAGSAAEFNVELNVSGAKTSYQNALITIELPNETEPLSKNNLGELNIFGVVPEYNAANNTLNYYFPSLVGGNIARVKLWLGTKNGVTPDKEEKEVKVTVKAGDEECSDTAKVMLRASGKAATSIYCDFDESDITLKDDRIGYYTVRVQVPKFGESGDLAVDVNRNIDVAVIFDSVLQLTYKSSSHGGELGSYPGYSTYGAILWSLDPSQFMEDEDGHLYAELTYEIEYPLITIGAKRELKFYLEATVPFIGNSSLKTNWQILTHSIFNNYSPMPDGGLSWEYIIYEGNEYTSIKDGVYPSMYVGDTFSTVVGLNSFPLMRGEVVESFCYEEPIDPERIRFDSFYTGEFREIRDEVYQPVIPLTMDGLKVSLLLDPIMNTWVGVSTNSDRTLTRADFGISDEQKVYALRVEMGECPAFHFGNWAEIYYTVVGEIPAAEEVYEQTSEYSVYFKNNSAVYAVIRSVIFEDGEYIYYREDGSPSYGNTKFDYKAFNTGINIQPEPQGTPTGKVAVRLTEPVSSMVENGQYTLEYKFENLKVSSDR